MNRLVPRLAVAAVAALAACSSPSVPPAPSTGSSTLTAITASRHVSEHTVPASHSPVPPHTVTPTKSILKAPAKVGSDAPVISNVLLTTRKKSTYSVNTLVVGSKSSAPKYLRDSQFGTWSDTDHNGCDTRNDVLKRDLLHVTFKAGSKCLVQTGELFDPYVGDDVPFTRGAKTSREVQIDHVVSVADAWKSGAWKWTPAKRIAFYNDPLNLLATEGVTNDFKSAKTADQYLPPLHKCEFAMVQIAVKNKYHLVVTQPELTALNYACAK
jgi:hypothetical protein